MVVGKEIWMPYIDNEVRERYGNLTIDQLLQRFRDAALIGQDTLPGDLNWVISNFMFHVFDANPSYRLGNTLMGVLESAKQEFYRRKLAPYEDNKIKENGDL